MALLFSGLGAMVAYWYFFWQNREMIPCAPVQVDGTVVEGIEIVQPYSEDLLIRRMAIFGSAGALIGMSLALVLVIPRARRLRRYEKDLLENDPEGS